MSCAPVVGRSGCWIPSSNAYIPPGAFCAGHDGPNQVYIIRAFHNGAWLPGKFVHGHQKAYVPWGGKEIAVENFEVLCHCQLRWTHCHSDHIPPHAFVAGNSENGEPLYIGRVMENGSTTIGKVQRSHRVCYVPYGGREVSHHNYEVLVE